MAISFVQMKMARGGLSLTVREMADLTGVSHDTVGRIERGEKLKGSTLKKVREALENIGVLLIGDDGIRIPKDAIDAAVKKVDNNP